MSNHSNIDIQLKKVNTPSQASKVILPQEKIVETQVETLQ